MKNKLEIFEHNNPIKFKNITDIPKIYFIDSESFIQTLQYDISDNPIDIRKEYTKLLNQGFQVIQNPIYDYIPKKEFDSYLVGLNYIIDPLSMSQLYGISQVLDQLKKLCRNHIQWKIVFDNLIKGIESTIQSGNLSADYDWKRISSFSNNLIQNIFREVVNIVDKLDHNLNLFNLRLDMNGWSYIDIFTIGISWRILAYGSSERLLKPINDFKLEKKNWLKLLESILEKNVNEMSKGIANNIFKDTGNNFKISCMRRISENMQLSLNKNDITDKFNAREIQKKLDEEILFKGTTDFEIVLDYIINQVRFIEKEFENMWNQAYKKLLGDNITFYEDSMKVFYRKFQKYVKHLMYYLEINKMTEYEAHQIFEDINEMKVQKSSAFDDKSQELSLYYQAVFKFFSDFCEGHFVENWKFSGKDKMQNILTIKFRNPSLFEKLDDTIPLNLSKYCSIKDQEVPVLYVFLSELNSKITDQLELVSKENINWSLGDLGLDNIFNKLKNMALACNKCCPTCGRKCDRDVEVSHPTHGCDLGHQIRGSEEILFI